MFRPIWRTKRVLKLNSSEINELPIHKEILQWILDTTYTILSL